MEKDRFDVDIFEDGDKCKIRVTDNSYVWGECRTGYSQRTTTGICKNSEKEIDKKIEELKEELRNCND
jgi:hypothetical protein